MTTMPQTSRAHRTGPAIPGPAPGGREAPGGAALRLPDFLCIGAMRCGSTTLWELLGRHGRVFLPRTKELHYFDNREGAFDRGPGWYARHFEAADPAQLVGECTPKYFYLDDARRRIQRLLPEAKFVLILRDPVKRAWSHYWFRARQGHEWLGFCDALDAEQDRLARTDDAHEKYRFAYTTVGQYAWNLEQWDNDVGRQRLCVILLEDLLANPSATIARVFAHLGLVPEEGVDWEELPHKNAASWPRHLWLHRLAKRQMAWAPHRSRPWHRLARRLGRCVRDLNLSPGTPPMPVAVRERLVAAFEQSNQKVAQRLGRQLPWI